MTTDAGRAAQQRGLAWAEALAGLDRVASTLSVRLRDIHAPATGTEADTPAARRALEPTAPRPTSAAGRSRLPRGGLGPRQQAALSLGGLDADLAIAAAAVAGSIGISAPNAHKLLTGLESLGALQRVPDERPVRWRRAQP